MTRISLYIKRHTDTGLKYLGVTTKDPYTQLGSGLYWTAHLEKHGNQMMTCVLGEFDDIEECSQVALQFSAEHDVVKSAEWANLKPENAKQGWVAGFPQTLESIQKRVAKNTGKKRTEETKRKISESRLGEKHWLYGVCGEDSHWFGRQHTPDSIEKMRSIKMGKTHSDETKAKHSMQTIGDKNPAAKWFVAIDTHGLRHFRKSLSTFSVEHSLSPACMKAVALGRNKQHKGWTVNYVDHFKERVGSKPALRSVA